MGAEAAVCLLCGHTEGEHGGRGCSNGWATDVRGCGCLHFAPSPLAHSLTPSEVALAKVLSAWVEWASAGKPENDDAIGWALRIIEKGLFIFGFVHGNEPHAAGAALLDKARRAGVL